MSTRSIFRGIKAAGA